MLKYLGKYVEKLNSLNYKQKNNNICNINKDKHNSKLKL